MALINPATLAIGADLLAKHGPKAAKFARENWPEVEGLVGKFSGAKRDEVEALQRKVAELVNTLDETERKLADAEAKAAQTKADSSASREFRLLSLVAVVVLSALAAFAFGFIASHLTRS